MELGADLPVTIVIKAPNQRIEDQTVDCMLGWTVKKLKEHLKSVYPNKPSEKHQKLIYSGKLLADDMVLKEVLRQFDDGSSRHTVHLVCSAPYTTHQSTSINKESQPGFLSTTSSPSSSQTHTTEFVNTGLRYRGSNPTNTNQSSPQTPFVNPVNPNVFSNFNYGGQFPTGFPPEAVAAMYGGMAPGPGMAYTAEQYMWMQQAYAQYMAQYMQYYQQAGYPMQTNVPGAGNEQNAENQNVENNNPQEAGGVADPDDGDEEFRQRDWLDYLYYFSRLMVLLGIVYFYSNLTRFIMVALFFLVVYLYQMGGGWLWWIPNRRGRNVQQQQQPQAEEQRPEQQANTEQDNSTEDTNTDTGNAQSEPPQTEPPQGPGPLKLTWTFISTFFTSLFPAPPPPVNIN